MDFVAHLLSSNLNLSVSTGGANASAPAPVQPRPLGRFEPLPGTNWLPMEETTAEDVQESLDVPLISPERPLDNRLPATPMPRRFSTDIPQPGPASPAPPNEQHLAPPEPALVRFEPAVPPTTEHETPIRAAPKPAVLAPAPEWAPTAPPPVGHGPESAPPTQPQRPVVVNSSPREPTPPSFAVQPRTSVPENVFTSPTPPQSAPPLAPAPLPSEARSSQRDVPPVSQPAPPETLVNITIGRVEVRLNPLPTPSPAQLPARPRVISLEEYLKRRERGER